MTEVSSVSTGNFSPQLFSEGGKGGGGSRSRFMEDKTVLSQFTKNKDIMKITVHGELNILFLVSWKIILQNHASRLLWKS